MEKRAAAIAKFKCSLCSKHFTRNFNLWSHQLTHTDERLFPCSICEKRFVRDNDRKVHESLHTGEKKFVCGGDLRNGQKWGCGRKFALAKNLLRHFRCETGKRCRAPVMNEEQSSRQDSKVVVELPAPESSSECGPYTQDTSYGSEKPAASAFDFGSPYNSTMLPPTDPFRPFILLIRFLRNHQTGPLGYLLGLTYRPGKNPPIGTRK